MNQICSFERGGWSLNRAYVTCNDFLYMLPSLLTSLLNYAQMIDMLMPTQESGKA